MDDPNITRIHACRWTSHGMTGSGHKGRKEVELQVVSSGSKMGSKSSCSYSIYCAALLVGLLAGCNYCNRWFSVLFQRSQK